jgi:hypothetical protein
LAVESYGGRPADYFAFRNLEAIAYGKWNFKPSDTSVEFLQYNGTDPAMRSRDDATGLLKDDDYELVAGAGAEVISTVDLRLANRTEQRRQLSMNLNAKTTNDANGSRPSPPWHFFDKAILQRMNGDKSTISMIWGGLPPRGYLK